MGVIRLWHAFVRCLFSITLHALHVGARLEYLEVCSHSCTCDDILLKVDCSEAEFSNVPDIRVNTRALILDGNQFSVVDDTFFERMTNLRFLSLAWNQIDDIQDGSFKSQRKVMKMDLKHNRLGEVPLALKHMKELIELDLSENQIGVLTNMANSQKTQEPWSNLTNIQRLMLDNNFLTLLPVVVFSKLAQLEYLSVSHNNLVAIPDGSLLNLHHLEYLNISFNNLTSSASYRLTPLNQTSGRLESALVLAEESDFSTAPTLEVDYLADNNANGVTPSTFKGLWNLRVLDLQENSIDELSTGMFSDLTALETLHLQGNKLQKIQEGTFNSLLEVLELYLQDNFLENLTDDMFESLRSLTVLNLDNNKLTDLMPFLDSSTHLFKLRIVSISNNWLQDIPPPGFSKLPALEELYLDSNILNSVPEVRGLSNLKIINLGRNQIREIIPINAFDGTSLENINLAKNNLETVLRETFHGLNNLQRVKLSGTKYICDCRLQWLLDDYDTDWMYDSYYYAYQISLIVCKKPKLFQNEILEHVMWSPENHKLKCTEYAESNIVTLLLLSWSGILGFFLLIFWFHTFLNFKKKFGTRHPKKRYMALYYADKTSTTPLKEGSAGQVTFRTFESESEGVDIVDEETTV